MNIKKGIDYRPLVCYFDDDTKLLIGKLGLAGYGCLQLLFNKMAMENGYFLEWSPRKQSLFTLDIYEKDERLIENCVQYCLDSGIFDKEMYEKHSVLTSREIQKDYKQITQKRINPWHAPQYVYPELIDAPKTLVAEYESAKTSVAETVISNNDSINEVTNASANIKSSSNKDCNLNITPASMAQNKNLSASNAETPQNAEKIASKIQSDVNLAQTDVILRQTDDILGQTDVILKQREREEERKSEIKKESEIKVIGEKEKNVSQTSAIPPPNETASVSLAQFLSQKLNKPLRNPNLMIDSNHVNLDSLYRAVRESVFLQNSMNLDIDWLIAHYDEVVAGKYKDFSAYKKVNPIAIRHRNYNPAEVTFNNIDDFL